MRHFDYRELQYCFSQDSSASVFYLNKLPTDGVLLNKGWKFQEGDNPDFAKPDYDDSKWSSIDPILDIHDQPQITKSGICWLRVTVLVSLKKLLIRSSNHSLQQSQQDRELD